MLTSEVTKRRENACVRKVLGERLSVGTDADRFAQVKACAAWPSAAAEGDARVGGSTVARTSMPGFFTINSYSYITKWGQPDMVE
jgi:hypothetical protein